MEAMIATGGSIAAIVEGEFEDGSERMPGAMSEGEAGTDERWRALPPLCKRGNICGRRRRVVGVGVALQHVDKVPVVMEHWGSRAIGFG